VVIGLSLNWLSGFVLLCLGPRNHSGGAYRWFQGSQAGAVPINRSRLAAQEEGVEGAGVD
jgi:hypothetical protein